MYNIQVLLFSIFPKVHKRPLVSDSSSLYPDARDKVVTITPYFHHFFFFLVLHLVLFQPSLKLIIIYLYLLKYPQAFQVFTHTYP